MAYSPITLKDKLSLLTELWQPRVVAELNDYQFKVAKIEGDFVWHNHPDTDEAFYILEGELRIDLRDGSVSLKTGDLYIVPKGVEHKPFAATECSILLIEPRNTPNTGNAGGERTAEQNIWI